MFCSGAHLSSLLLGADSSDVPFQAPRLNSSPLLALDNVSLTLAMKQIELDPSQNNPIRVWSHSKDMASAHMPQQPMVSSVLLSKVIVSSNRYN
jgi:hypothetical protein